MSPLLPDPAMMHDQDSVDLSYCGESVGHYKGGSFLSHLRDRLLNEPLCFRVHT